MRPVEISFVTKVKTENLPPTENALYQHTRRALFQAGIWAKSTENNPHIPNPCDHGWKLEEGMYVPVWITVPELSKSCQQLVKCSCKSVKADCSKCFCGKDNIECSPLCDCPCTRDRN